MTAAGTHEVCVPGPNLTDQSKGEFHVHTADCRDLANYGPGTRYGGDPIKATDYCSISSKLELVQIVYGDILDESGAIPEEYLSSFHWAPCVNDLPLGITVSSCTDVRDLFPSQAGAAALLKGAA